MITKVQTKLLTRPIQPPPVPLRLNTMERGLLRWSMAEAGDRVLDASVATGALLEALQREQHCEICGMSDDMEQVKQARGRLENADIAYATPEDIPWRENAFDTVYLCPEGADCQRALREALRVLKPGGQLLAGIRWLPNVLRRMRCALTSGEETTYRERQQFHQTLASVGFLQISWQPVDLTHGVMIGWKPMEPIEENEARG